VPCIHKCSPAHQQVVAMAKKGIHPEWHNEAKVICNGEEVLTTSGTRDSYTGAWAGRAGAQPAGTGCACTGGHTHGADGAEVWMEALHTAASF